MRNGRFQILDGWRGVCALLVALYHLPAYDHFYGLPFFQNSWLFVDFFFVLSGFVISHAYIGRLGSWLETRSFILRRFGRLWPPHVAVLATLVGVELTKLILLKFGFSIGHPAFSNGNNIGSIITNIFLIHALGIQYGWTWNGPSWSISVEFYTYIVFAALFMLPRKFSRSIAPSLAIVFISAGIVFLFSTHGIDISTYYAFFRCLFGFFVGHLTYRIWKSGSGRQLVEEFGAVEFIAVALAVVFVSLVGRTVWSLAAPFIFGFVIWVFAHESGPVSHLMNVRATALLGAWSYSIYMVHGLVVRVLAAVMELVTKTTGLPLKMSLPWKENTTELYFFGSQWATDGLTVVYLVSVILLAAVTYNLIEKPGQRFFNSLAGMHARKVSASGIVGAGAEPD